MKNLYKIIGLALFCFILFLFFPIIFLNKDVQQKTELNYKDSIVPGEENSNFDFSIDKNNYTYGETLKLNISFGDFAKGDTVKLRVSGIKDFQEKNLLNKLREVEIKDNFYKMVYNVKLPELSNCSGPESGEHLIKVDVIKGNQIIKSKTQNIILE